MADIITEARDLIQKARSQERCLREAKNVERRLEDLKDAASAGNWLVATGSLAVVGGLVGGFFTAWTGAGALGGAAVTAGGITTISIGLAAKRDAMAAALKELRRAIEDLQECLG